MQAHTMSYVAFETLNAMGRFWLVGTDRSGAPEDNANRDIPMKSVREAILIGRKVLQSWDNRYSMKSKNSIVHDVIWELNTL